MTNNFCPVCGKDLELPAWVGTCQAVVINNPNASDQGTAFQPDRGKAYFDDLK